MLRWSRMAIWAQAQQAALTVATMTTTLAASGACGIESAAPDRTAEATRVKPSTWMPVPTDLIPAVPPQPASEVVPPTPGLWHSRRDVAEAGVVAYIFVADLTRLRLVGIDARSDDRIVAPVEVLRAEADAHVAINGTFFDGKRRPLGLLISEHATLSPLRTADWGVLTVDEQGTAALVHTRDFRASDTIDFAVQCGPRVVIDGTPPRLKEQVARRTGLCIQGPQQLALFVVDAPVEANILAAWLARSEADDGLGCRDALLLDGGPSSQLDEREGTTHPSIRGGWGVPNAVGVVTRPGG